MNKQQTMSATLPNRSVNDFPSEQDLKKALLLHPSVEDALQYGETAANAQQQRQQQQQQQQSHHHHHQKVTSVVVDASLTSETSICSDERSFTAATATSTAADNGDADECCLDWRLVAAAPNAETVEEEWKRLLALRSYRILDQRESTVVKDTLQGLVDLMRATMDAPYAFITLVDLGRAYVLASSGEGTPACLRELPRRKSYCAHVIVAEDVLVVEDARQDERFCDLDVARSTPFYTGIPLIVPEGFKIGALCILDDKPRPEGITCSQRSMLQQGAQLIVQALVCHRQLTQQQDQLARVLQTSAVTAHSIVTPLTGLQLSLSTLKDDKDLQLSPSQQECLDTAHSCALVVRNISQSLRPCSGKDESSSLCCSDNQKRPAVSKTMPPTNNSRETNTATTSRLQLQEMAHRLHAVMEAVPKKVPVSVHAASVLELSLPKDLEVEIFRAALSLVTHVRERATLGTVRFSLAIETLSSSSSSSADHEVLLMQCSTTACETLLQKVNEEDESSSSDLPLVIQRVESLGGTFGIDKKEPEVRYWFRLPIMTPSEEEVPSSVSDSSDVESTVSAGAKRSLEEASVETPLDLSATATTTTTTKKKKAALVIDDSLVVRKCMARALSKLDYDHVDVAEDGMIGLRKLRQTQYDLVWCDFLMPHMDGMDCIREYRKWEKVHRPGYRQFIVGMSAHASVKDVETALTLGMDDYRHKPVTLDCIRALSGTRMGDPAAQQDNEDTSCTKNYAEAVKKRRTLDQESSNQKACLIAASAAIQNELRECAEASGFDAVVVENGQEALGLLKSRNWRAVFLDSCLPELDGMQCAQEFRIWEQCNRVNRQRNIHLICDGYRRRGSLASSSDYCRRDSSESGDNDSVSLANLPDGVDGVVGKPIQQAEIQELFQELQDDYESTARPSNIVMRL